MGGKGINHSAQYITNGQWVQCTYPALGSSDGRLKMQGERETV